MLLALIVYYCMNVLSMAIFSAVCRISHAVISVAFYVFYFFLYRYWKYVKLFLILMPVFDQVGYYLNLHDKFFGVKMRFKQNTCFTIEWTLNDQENWKVSIQQVKILSLLFNFKEILYLTFSLIHCLCQHVLIRTEFWFCHGSCGPMM